MDNEEGESGIIARSVLMRQPGFWPNIQVLIVQHVKNGLMQWRKWGHMNVNETMTTGATVK